jgi:hypothetical protein
MVDGLPKEMREPRKGRPMCGTDEAWFYVNQNSVDIYATSSTQAEVNTTTVRLTRRQLERALETMDYSGV